MRIKRTGFTYGLVTAALTAMIATTSLRADDDATAAQQDAAPQESASLEAPSQEAASPEAAQQAAAPQELPSLLIHNEAAVAEETAIEEPAELPTVDQAPAAGFVRISDSPKHAATAVPVPAGPACYGPSGACDDLSVEISGHCVRDHWRMHKMKRKAEHRAKMIDEGHAPDCTCQRCQDPTADRLARVGSHLHRRYGYFCPSGGSGAGVQTFEAYGMVYPVNPGYFDARDGRLFSAQGFGVPVAVPLAPNVSHTYNFGWGIPSSRLTPISRPVHHPGFIGSSGKGR